MKKLSLRLTTIKISLILVAVWFSSCTKKDVNDLLTGLGLNGGPFYMVSINNNGFAPDSLTVKKGFQMQWNNATNTTHILASTTDPAFSATIAAYGSFNYTPQVAGTLKYYCTVHNEKGMLVIIP